jgi:hypothetical protein
MGRVLLAALSSASEAGPQSRGGVGRHLRGGGGGLPAAFDRPGDRPAAFALLVAVAAAAVLGSLLCLWRDSRRHQQNARFEAPKSASCGLSPGGGGGGKGGGTAVSLRDLERPAASIIESHVEGVLEAVLGLQLPARWAFSPYLATLQALSPLYAALRCLRPALADRGRASIASNKSAPLSIIWFLFLTRAVNLLLSEAVLTYLFLANPGVCGGGSAGASRAACLSPRGLDGTSRLCAWDGAAEECRAGDSAAAGSAEDIGNHNIYYYLVLALVSVLLAAPLNLLCERLVGAYADAMCVHAAARAISRFSLPTRLVECTAPAPAPSAELTQYGISGGRGRGRACVRLPRETLVRAVRLLRLQSSDLATPAEERLGVLRAMGQRGQQRTRLYRLYGIPLSTTSPEAVDSRVGLQLQQARRGCEHAAAEVMPLLGQLSREVYLARLFLLQSVEIGASSDISSGGSGSGGGPAWRGVCGVAAARYLFGTTEGLVPSARSPLVDPHSALLPRVDRGAACLAALLLYVLGSCLGLYIFATHMSRYDADAWIARFVVTYLIVFTVIEPVKAFVYDFSVSTVAAAALAPAVLNLLSRAGFVLSRVSGQLCLGRAGVQHSMAACRLARAFPALPMARLLMSLRDSDVILRVAGAEADLPAPPPLSPECCGGGGGGGGGRGGWGGALGEPGGGVFTFMKSSVFPVAHSLSLSALGAAYALSLLLGSRACAAAAAALLVALYAAVEMYFFWSLIERIVSAPGVCVAYAAALWRGTAKAGGGGIAKYSPIKHRPSGDADLPRAASAESLEARDNFDFRNVDSMEIGFFSERQETIRSQQKSNNSPSPVKGSQSSFNLRSTSLNSFESAGGLEDPAGSSAGPGPSRQHSRRSLGSGSLGSVSEERERERERERDPGERSGPIMLIKHMSSSQDHSSSEDEESSDEDEDGGRGIDALLGGRGRPSPIKLSPIRSQGKSFHKSKSPTKSPTSTSSRSPKDRSKNSHYSPALNRLSSLRRSGRPAAGGGSPGHASDAAGADQSPASQGLLPLSSVPDVSAVGDIKRNRWTKLRRNWASGKSALSSNAPPTPRDRPLAVDTSADYPIPYTLLQALDDEDSQCFDDKLYIFGHRQPTMDSKRVCRALRGKVLSVSSCSFDDTGSLWIHDVEDDAWFFAFDMVLSRRGAVIGSSVLPSLVTVLHTELRAPHSFGGAARHGLEGEEMPWFETMFTIQLLFVKGTAVELRRSFGALADLSSAVESSLRVMEQRRREGGGGPDADADEKKVPFRFFSPLPVDREGLLSLYEENESNLGKFVAKVVIRFALCTTIFFPS